MKYLLSIFLFFCSCYSSTVYKPDINYTEAEVIYNAKNGWKRVKNEVPTLTEKVDIKEQYKKKFGKYPHHLKKLSSIVKELNDDS